MLASRLFNYDDDGEPLDRGAEAEAEAALRAAEVPFSKIGWDSYDSSIEFYGVPPDWRMPGEIQRRLWDEGFIKAYVNHTDKWETHYSFGTANGYKEQRGWRVSYPHKRDQNNGQIWVEEKVSGWPKKWFESRLWWRKPYVAVKPPKKR